MSSSSPRQSVADVNPWEFKPVLEVKYSLLLLLLLNTFIQNRKGDKNASLGGYITPVRKSSLTYKYSTDTYKATEKYIKHK